MVTDTITICKWYLPNVNGMVTDAKQTKCSGPLAIYTNVKLICCTSETSITVSKLYSN